MPAGAEVMVPLPVPALIVVSRKRCGPNVPVTVRLFDSVTVHGPVPVQPPPLQLVKLDTPSGTGVSTTAVPVAKASVQSAPQLMPPGLEVIAPVPPVAVTMVLSV